MNNTTGLFFENPSIEEVTNKEWIVTNGIGGYASSTICGLNSRRYHGLLVAALNPPAERKVYVAKIEEKLIVNGQSIDLASNIFRDNFIQEGYRHLREFRRKPFPTFRFCYDNISIEKEVFMVYGHNTSVINYKNKSESPITLILNPLYIERDFHWLSKDHNFNYYYKEESNYIKIYAKEDSLPLYVKFPKGKFTKNRQWHNNFQFKEEEDRGLNYEEDLYSIGEITVELAAGEEFYVIFSLEEEHMKGIPAMWATQETARLKRLIPKGVGNKWVQDLILSGNQFIVKRNSTDSTSIIAGYHWFSDWGRDTMISIRGLCIALGKREEAESILKTFLKYLDQGMLPNRFPDTGEIPEYNTVDATLWLFVALYEYHQAFNDLPFIESIFPQLDDIIEWHKKGTRFSIHLTKEGLIYAGDPDSQLTWMDAKCNGIAITPRYGCAVEINALWYNSLKIIQLFSKLLKKDPAVYDDLIGNCESSFRKYFINTKGYLNDVVIPDVSVDYSFRSNQIYAISLPFGMLTKQEEKALLIKIKEELYTSYGLRTLSPTDPNFKKTYSGDTWIRDNAYHQGTVWGFLLGEFLSAYLKVNEHSNESQEWVEQSLHAIRLHFYYGSCINGISEIFDGENPHAGKGTIHQAWSIGNLLNVIIYNNLYKGK